MINFSYDFSHMNNESKEVAKKYKEFLEIVADRYEQELNKAKGNYKRDKN